MALRLLPAPAMRRQTPRLVDVQDPDHEEHHEAADRVHQGRGQGPQLAALLHRDERVTRAERQLQTMIADLLADASGMGFVRDDISVNELAAFASTPWRRPAGCLRSLPPGRLVEVTGAGLRAPL